MFILIGILMFVEEGKIDLDKILSIYFFNFKNKLIFEFVIVYYFLFYIGGIGDIFGFLFDKNRFLFKSYDDYIRLYEEWEVIMLFGNIF